MFRRTSEIFIYFKIPNGAPDNVLRDLGWKTLSEFDYVSIFRL